jgi:hypothetical protein
MIWNNTAPHTAQLVLRGAAHTLKTPVTFLILRSP